MEIRKKLTIAFLAIASLILVLGYIAIIATEEELKDNIGNEMASLASITLREIDAGIYTRIEELRAYSQTGFVMKGLKENNKEFGEKSEVDEYIAQQDEIWKATEKEEVTPFIKELIENDLSIDLTRQLEFYEKEYGHPIFGEIFITNRYGANIAQTGKTSDYYQADEAWWQSAKEEGVSISDVEFDESAGIFSVDISIKIEDENGEFVGVLKAPLDIEESKNIIESIRASPGQENHEAREVTLVTKDNLVLYSTHKDDILVLNDLEVSDELVKGNTYFAFTGKITGNVVEEGEEQNSENKKLIAYADSTGFRDYTGLGWRLIIEHDEMDALASVEQIKKLLFFVAFIIMIAAMSAGIYIADDISRPIRRLSKIAGEIGRGNLRVKAEVKSNDEVGLLTKTFNEMTDNLRIYQQKLIESERKREKELQKEVDKKTKEMREYVKKLEKAKETMTKMMNKLREVDETKTNFLNIVSHELKTPLTAIFAYLDVLDGTKLKLDGDQTKAFEALRRNSQQLKMLIGNILEISRIEAGKFELSQTPINPEQKIKDVVDNLQILAKKRGIEIRHQVTNVPKKIITDEPRFEEILNNLVSNALKFTHEGYVAIKAQQKGKFLLVDVEDTGVGIPKEKVNNLFQKFYQVDSSISRKYGGTGLGLSITKQLVELQNGTIAVKSTEGKGTTFSFTLPVKGVASVKRMTLEKQPVSKERKIHVKKAVQDKGLPLMEIDEIESSFGKL